MTRKRTASIFSTLVFSIVLTFSSVFGSVAYAKASIRIDNNRRYVQNTNHLETGGLYVFNRPFEYKTEWRWDNGWGWWIKVTTTEVDWESASRVATLRDDTLVFFHGCQLNDKITDASGIERARIDYRINGKWRTGWVESAYLRS
jgi:hypothetical protein